MFGQAARCKQDLHQYKSPAKNRFLSESHFANQKYKQDQNTLQPREFFRHGRNFFQGFRLFSELENQVDNDLSTGFVFRQY